MGSFYSITYIWKFYKHLKLLIKLGMFCEMLLCFLICYCFFLKMMCFAPRGHHRRTGCEFFFFFFFLKSLIFFFTKIELFHPCILCAQVSKWCLFIYKITETQYSHLNQWNIENKYPSNHIRIRFICHVRQRKFIYIAHYNNKAIQSAWRQI